MLALSKRIDYAIVALAYLAQRPGRTASAREIAEANELPPPLLMNLLKELQQHGFVNSTRGTKGGYHLGSNSDSVCLYDLVLALEGPVHLVECVTEEDASPAFGIGEHGMSDGFSSESDACRMSGHCTIQGPMSALHHRLVDFLRGLKLSEIIRPTNHAGSAEGPNDLDLS